MVTTGTSLAPAFLRTLKDFGRRGKNKLEVILNGLAIIIQISGLIILPMASSQHHGNFAWAFIIGQIMTSLGWWEAFVDKRSIDPISRLLIQKKIKKELQRVMVLKIFDCFRYLWRLKTSMQENKTRYWVYSWISIWKIVLFFMLLISFDAKFYSETQSGGRNRASNLFNMFDLSGNGYTR